MTTIATLARLSLNFGVFLYRNLYHNLHRNLPRRIRSFAAWLLGLLLLFPSLAIAHPLSEFNKQSSVYRPYFVEFYTNRHKDVIAQRKFSASETRQRMKGIVTLRSSSFTQYQKC
ncbi:hypothetical protein [Shewanella waksmanii]|uniref:hypothetical protein n=1 Tax=Shewanella waksmanii TaxID=213783 RepID=UPI003735425D